MALVAVVAVVAVLIFGPACVWGHFDCSLAKSPQGTSEAKVLGCTRASEPMHLGPANLTPASAQDNVLMQLSSELHQHLPEAASEATTLFLLELACRHPIQVSLLCLKGQFVSLSFLQKLPAKMTWASNIQRHNAIK